jgi:hypothetical protein
LSSTMSLVPLITSTSILNSPYPIKPCVGREKPMI